MEQLSLLEVLEAEDRALSGVDEPCATSNAELFKRLHERRRSALCFSGGGIRSATFGLGILQGLAAFSRKSENERPALLGEFDYLSTVSGGGYLGGWFSAWAARAGQGDQPRVRECKTDTAEDGPAKVITELSGAPDTTFEPEPDPVKHLREYTNYLSPRAGLLSADTWALAATVLRNIVLNWLVLIPLFLAVLLIPLLARNLVDLNGVGVSYGFLWVLFASAAAAGGLATAYIGYDLPNAGNRRRSTNVFLLRSLLPISLAATLLNIFWAWLPEGNGAAPFWDFVGRGKAGLHWQHFALLGAVMHGGGMLLGIVYVSRRYKRPARKIGIVATLGAVLTGFVAGLAGDGLSHLPDYANGYLVHHRVYTVVAFPMVMGLFLLAGTLLVGITSYVTEDEDREWWARAGGWYLAVAGGWLVFAGLVLYAGVVLDFMNVQLSAAFTALTGMAGWTAASAGASSRTKSGREQEQKPMGQLSSKSFATELAGRLALPVFLVLLTMLLAMGNTELLRLMKHWPDKLPSLWPGPLKAPGDATAHALLLGIVYLLIGLLWSLVVNVNKFSLHGMYRQRLIRAYLGASNKNRMPNLFTGFDDNDNLPMCALSPHKPMHIVNMALNLVHGSKLAWQQRKAESFTVSRLHSGSCRLGYRPSQSYGGRYRDSDTRLPITLGTAITISGAAASPNMGYHSSPLLTIVMTLFNARLGWWLGNPACADENVWKRPGPTIGLVPFVEEALGLTDDRNDWIYLSDGGHFENLGLYEMVLRRCHLIVVSDAGADPKFEYEDLGNAVRKIRVDLGIPITFERPSMPMAASGKADSEYSGHHCAIGRIHYEAKDEGAAPGVLIYIKASMNANEPADVKQYWAANRAFPHQPTSDQFFDEAQFESYRRLGLHVVEEICSSASPMDSSMTLEEFRRCAEDYAQVSPRRPGPLVRLEENVFFEQSA